MNDAKACFALASLLNLTQIRQLIFITISSNSNQKNIDTYEIEESIPLVEGMIHNAIPSYLLHKYMKA